MKDFDELELPPYSKVVSAYPDEIRDKEISIKFEKKTPNSVTEGQRLTTKTIGGLFTLIDNEGNETNRCFYDLSDGTPGSPFVINQLQVLDLRKPVHFANYMVLKEYLKSFPDASDGITIIDEQQNKAFNISNEEQLFMIKSRIIAMKNKPDELKKMYRRKIGAVMGITTEAIYAKLFDFTNESPMDAAEYFESIGDENEEIRAIIDLAKEKGVVTVKDKTHLLVATNTIIGSDYDSSIFRLRQDSTLLADIKNSISERKVERVSLMDIKKESLDTSKWSLEESVKSAIVNSTSDSGEFHLEANDDVAMEDFIKNLQKNKVIAMDQKKRYNSDLLPIEDLTRVQLALTLKKNTGLIKQAKAFLREV